MSDRISGQISIQYNPNISCGLWCSHFVVSVAMTNLMFRNEDHEVKSVQLCRSSFEPEVGQEHQVDQVEQVYQEDPND